MNSVSTLSVPLLNGGPLKTVTCLTQCSNFLPFHVFTFYQDFLKSPTTQAALPQILSRGEKTARCAIPASRLLGIASFQGGTHRRQSVACLVIFHPGHSVYYSSVTSSQPIIPRPSVLLEFSTSPSSKLPLDHRMKHLQTPKLSL